MIGRATGCLKKSGPRKKVLAIFSCWMVLYGPKQCCMIRAYRCAALDTPLAYIRKKIDPRPPGPWGRFLATGPDFGPKICFCYRTPDFVNGPFVVLDDIFDLAPSDRFLNFLNQESYRVPKKSGPRKKGFWPFSLAGWFYMDRNNAV